MASTKNVFSNLSGDAFGGITAGIVALPLALAFGVQSGLGAAAGLYGAFIIGIVAAIFGGTPTQISGPTAPMTVVSSAAIASILAINDGNLSKALPIILAVFLIAGLLQILMGVIKLGQYIKYIPYPVVSGFMTGIGVIILITQIFSLVGYTPTKDAQLVESFKPQAKEVILDKILKAESGTEIMELDDFRETIRRGEQITETQLQEEARTLTSRDAGGVLGSVKYIPRALQNINWLEFGLALLTIFIIYGFKRITKKVPSTLVALIVVTLAAQLLSVDVLTVSDNGTIPVGFPPFQLSIFTDLNLGMLIGYLGTAFALAGLGAIDSLLTSVVADNMTKTRHNSNQELIGQGIGNSIAALFGGIPGAGATIRTVVNINSGGKTKISGIIHGLVLLLILLVLGPFASNIPISVLAGILFTVGIGVMDYKGLRALPKMPRTDAIVLIVVLVLTVFLDLITAVGIGLILAALMFMKRMGDITAEESKVVSLKDSEIEPKWQDEEGLPSSLNEAVYIKHLNGPLFFGYTNEFRRVMSSIPEGALHLLIRMDKVSHIDQSGLFALEDVLLDLIKRNIKVSMIGLREQPNYRLKSIDIIPDLIPEERLFKTFESYNAYIKEDLVEYLE